MQAIEIRTTAESESTLSGIAAELLENQLAACCQISGPVKSIYRWQGKTETAEEFVCSIKTIVEHRNDVFAMIAKLHPYDEPEIVVTELDGSASYLKWIAESVRQ